MSYDENVTVVLPCWYHMVVGDCSGSACALATNEMEAAARKLREHGIVPCVELQSFICVQEGCKCEVPFKRKSFRDHLKKRVHNGVSGDVFGDVWDSAVVCANGFAKGDRDVIAKYRQGGWSVGVLPTLIGLPVVKGKKCPKCDKLFESDNALRNHSKVGHGETLSREEIKSMGQVLCQSLGRQTKSKKLFRCDAAGLVDRKGVESSGEADGSGGIGDLLMKYDHGEMVRKTAGTSIQCDRRKGSFASLARCSERLSIWSLSLEDAWKLWKYPSEEEEKLLSIANEVTGVLKEYAGEAHRIFRDAGSFYSVLWDIGTPGVGEKKKKFKFLDRDKQGFETESRYCRSARTVILVACRVIMYRERYSGIEVEPELARDIGNLLRADLEEKEDVLEKVHRVLYSIFFQKSSIVDGSKKLFASVVGACLCVGGPSAERLYIRRGKEVSPYVSGILYFVSCCALLEMRKFCTEESREVVEAEITKAMGHGTKAGLTVFVELRTICATVRMEESPLHLFVKCNVHERCGIYEGVEFSMKSLGEAVRNMQDSVRRVLLGDILFGKPLIPGLRERCSAIRDEATCVVPGYWALSDTRNRVLVTECMKWVRDNVTNMFLKGLAEERLRKGKVEQFMQDLLTLMHVVGGAPGRGTEIGSIGVRNTATRQRGVFFAGPEVIVVPTYNKTRSMHGGVMRFISRHLDSETSFLFKCFFLLVHPLYAVISCRALRKEGEKGNVESEVQEERVRDDLCIGCIAAENVAKVVGSCFSRYGIPFSFSSYRHWQRGYIKMGRKHALQRRILSEYGQMSWEEEDEEAGSIVQAGHSVKVAHMVYARDSSQLVVDIGVDSDRVEMYRRASREWHIDLGIEEWGVRKGGTEGDGVGSMTTIGGLGVAGVSICMSDADVANLARSIVSGLSEKSSGRIYESKEVVENGVLVGGEGDGVEECAQESMIWDDGENGMNEEKFDPLTGLRMFLKNPDAEFRSPEQKRAMKAVADKKADVAIILATGMGKTAVVMGPILFEEGFTLWVSPL